MIGKRWNKLHTWLLTLLIGIDLLIIAGIGLLCIALQLHEDTTIPGNVGAGLLLLVIILSFAVASIGEKHSKGKSLTENDLVENEIYKLVGPVVVSHESREKAIFHAFLEDRDGYIGAFRLLQTVPSRFKVVKDEDGNRIYKPYPEPESPESQPAEQQ